MTCQVDDFWATPSTLHMRVIVWGPDFKWRQKFRVDVPIGDLSEDSLRPLLERLGGGHAVDLAEQLPLF